MIRRTYSPYFSAGIGDSSVRKKLQKIHIIGGGFSGLTLAYELSKQNKFDITVHESSTDWGGLIQTYRLGDGLAETAANAFFAQKAIVDLCEEIGAQPLLKKKTARKRFIFRNFRARQWPLGFLETLYFIFRGLLFWVKKIAPKSGEPLSSWWERCFGSISHRFLISPALQGIYAGDTQKMSANLFYRNLFLEEKSPRHPKIKGSFSFEHGMQDFFKALLQSLEKKNVLLKTKDQPNEKEIDLWLKDDEWVIFCCGPKATLNYLHGLQIQSDETIIRKLNSNFSMSNLIQLLEELEMISIIKVTILFDQPMKSRNRKDPQGFGILFPSEENFNSLGVLMDHWIFDHRGENICETWILGGALKPEMLELTDEQIIEAILMDRKRIFAEHPKIKNYRITRWRKTLPHYTETVNKLARWNISQTPPLLLHGNYLGKIGLSRIYEESIRLAQKIGNQ